MKDYHHVVTVAEPLSYLGARLSEVSLEASMLDVRKLLLTHIEQHLMGWVAQPKNLSSMLSDILPSDLKDEISEVTHDMIHGCFYRFNQLIDGDTVVGVNIIGDDAWILVEPTEEINHVIDQNEEMFQQY
ncbi:MAG: hypothetical protein CL582_10345 [Alteromonadaceae bacterium]|nr:hypothetical protein [Alteromonadaceae bacterium]|tara:strand:+ start:9459 stop:9848 length:390 start_codon:yes stop_codon:yes gene_type:complete